MAASHEPVKQPYAECYRYKANEEDQCQPQCVIHAAAPYVNSSRMGPRLAVNTLVVYRDASIGNPSLVRTICLR